MENTWRNTQAAGGARLVIPGMAAKKKSNSSR
jgi:hypothetical protein